MKTGLEMAKCYLDCCGYSLVVVKECVEIISRERGILPLLMLYDKCQVKLDGATLADKVIGKAAAFIIAETNVREVYARVMSEKAIPVLEKKSIKYGYDTLVSEVMNSDGDGICPLENICRDIDSPIEGIMAITAFICSNKCSADDRAVRDNGNCKYN